MQRDCECALENVFNLVLSLRAVQVLVISLSLPPLRSLSPVLQLKSNMVTTTRFFWKLVSKLIDEFYSSVIIIFFRIEQNLHLSCRTYLPKQVLVFNTNFKIHEFLLVENFVIHKLRRLTNCRKFFICGCCCWTRSQKACSSSSLARFCRATKWSERKAEITHQPYECFNRRLIKEQFMCWWISKRVHVEEIASLNIMWWNTDECNYCLLLPLRWVFRVLFHYFLFLLLQPKHFRKYQANERDREMEKITY